MGGAAATEPQATATRASEIPTNASLIRDLMISTIDISMSISIASTSYAEAGSR
jgi:hypothetical protein